MQALRREALLSTSSERLATILSQGLLVAGVGLLGMLVGIFSRPMGNIALLWPANALLLGMFVRNPQLASPWGWIAAFLGCWAAGPVAGGDLARVAIVTLAYLSGVAVGVWLYRRVSEDDQRLRRPLSVLYLFGISAAMAIVSAVGAMVVTVQFLGDNLLAGTFHLFMVALANSVIIVPVLLTAPAALFQPRQWAERVLTFTPFDLTQVLPLIALVGSAAAGMLVGGPGAIAFPFPALIWCAVTYDLFTTAVVTMVYSIWKMTAHDAGIVPTPIEQDVMGASMSLLLGVTLLALGPLTVASINAARNDLLRRLDRAANTDFLTGALTRSAFMERSQRLLDDGLGSYAHFAVLAMDIDQFKQINDNFGHAVGDQVLMAFARAATPELRSGDLFGRLGGEEFVAILPCVSRAEALEMAEGVRQRVADTALPLEDGQVVQFTVSIGVGVQQHIQGHSVDSALVAADRALYAAKAAGRNTVMAAGEEQGTRLPSAELPPAAT